MLSGNRDAGLAATEDNCDSRPGERDFERFMGLLDALVDALIQGHEGHVMRSPATTTTIMRMSDFDG